MSEPIVTPQRGDILVFYRAHRWIDYLIKLFTRSRYYHVGIYAGDQEVLEARPKGVIRDPIGDRKNGYTVVRAPDGIGEKALSWGASKIGAQFDRTDYMVIILEHLFVHLHINHVPNGKYSCTEFVAEAFDHAGVRLFPGRDINDLEPKEFADLKLDGKTS